MTELGIHWAELLEARFTQVGSYDFLIQQHSLIVLGLCFMLGSIMRCEILHLTTEFPLG